MVVLLRLVIFNDPSEFEPRGRILNHHTECPPTDLNSAVGGSIDDHTRRDLKMIEGEERGTRGGEAEMDLDPRIRMEKE